MGGYALSPEGRKVSKWTCPKCRGKEPAFVFRLNSRRCCPDCMTPVESDMNSTAGIKIMITHDDYVAKRRGHVKPTP